MHTSCIHGLFGKRRTYHLIGMDRVIPFLFRFVSFFILLHAMNKNPRLLILWAICVSLTTVPVFTFFPSLLFHLFPYNIAHSYHRFRSRCTPNLISSGTFSFVENKNKNLPDTSSGFWNVNAMANSLTIDRDKRQSNGGNKMKSWHPTHKTPDHLIPDTRTDDAIKFFPLLSSLNNITHLFNFYLNRTICSTPAQISRHTTTTKCRDAQSWSDWTSWTGIPDAEAIERGVPGVCLRCHASMLGRWSWKEANFWIPVQLFWWFLHLSRTKLPQCWRLLVTSVRRKRRGRKM